MGGKTRTHNIHKPSKTTTKLGNWVDVVKPSLWKPNLLSNIRQRFLKRIAKREMDFYTE